jgi:hypothetical protein
MLINVINPPSFEILRSKNINNNVKKNEEVFKGF